MASVPTPGGRSGPPSPRARRGICLLAPCVALLCVPLYAGGSPSLFGVPFFYWYQLAWALLAPALLALAHSAVDRSPAIGVAR